jgi:hypothetical protein
MTQARDLADGKFANDLIVDTNTLYVDSTNNRIGVGTATPFGVKFHVAGGVKATDLISHDSSGINLQTDEGTKRLILDDGGRITMPSQPHFQGWFNATFGAGSSVGTRITTSIHVKENTGNMFNTSNYRWTVPVAGMYMIHLQYLKANNTSASHHVDWSINGQGANSTYRVRASEGATYDQSSGTWIFYLQANDYLELFQHGSGGIHDYHASIIVRLMN